MTRSADRRLPLLVAILSVVVAAVCVRYAVEAGAGPTAVASMLIVSGSFVTTGLLAWTLRPANRMGRLMVALGLCLLLIAFAQPVVPLLVPFGLTAFTVSSALLGWLVLAYPSGELRTSANRALVAFAGLAVGGPRFLRLIVTDPAAQGSDRVNPYYFLHEPGILAAMGTIPYLLDIVVLCVFVVVVAVRWQRASGPTRRSLSPVLLPTLGLLFVLIADALTIVIPVSPATREFFDNAQLLARTVFPIGFLIGLLRTRMARSAIADLVVELGSTPTPARLRDALANALGDPTLIVGHWSPEAAGYVDAGGAAVALPGADAHRGVTLLAREGAPLAAIIHDPVLLDDPGLVAAVAGALRLAVENERLQGEVESQLDEVRASRARIVEAGDAERRRVERDLHDGAQQRLVSLTLALRLARSKAGDDIDPALAASLDDASAEVRAALSELRELARGIHPQILTGSGLGPALESLAGRSPVGVTVNVAGGRYPAAVEGAAYFAVSEGLANVAKYANAGHVDIRGGWAGGALTIEIADDGIGGADPERGSGLRGLADRLAAIDGTLEVVSPIGGGTRLLARIPTLAPTETPA
jgi:signal transduction histidine kinase